MMYAMPNYAGEMKFKPIMLTPERAEQLLANNHPRNRRMKIGKIEQMCNDIREGNWKLTPEAIVVSDHGSLLDGQNRCTACTKTGIPIPVFFCTGVPEAVVVAMDCGASRNVADAAKILGKDLKNVQGMASVARRMAAGFRAAQAHPDTTLSIQETLAWIECHKNALAFVWECLPINKIGITQASVRAVIARAYYKRPVEETRLRLLEFGECLLEGLPKNSKQDSSAIRLRNWLQDHFSQATRGRAKTAGIRVSAAVVYAKTETALAHFLAREHVDQLRETRNELFFLPGEKGREPEIGLMEETA